MPPEFHGGGVVKAVVPQKSCCKLHRRSSDTKCPTQKDWSFSIYTKHLFIKRAVHSSSPNCKFSNMSTKYLYKKYRFFLLSYVKNPCKVPNIINVCAGLILCFVDFASRYNRVKKNHLDAQLILRIFHQPLHVSGVSRSIIRGYNPMYTTIGTYYSQVQPYVYNNWYVLVLFLGTTLCIQQLVLIIIRYNRMYKTIGTYYSQVQPYVYKNWYLLFLGTTVCIQQLVHIILRYNHMYTKTGTYYSQVQLYVYNNWYLLFFLDDCLSTDRQTII